MKATQLNAENFKYSPFQLIFVVCLVFNEWQGLKVQGQFRQRFQASIFFCRRKTRRTRNYPPQNSLLATNLGFES